MTLASTLHAPAAGIRLAWPAARTVVLDPGTSEQARRRNIARERYLTGLTVALALTAVVVLKASQPYDRPWPAAAALLLTALAAAAARPARRIVPAALVEVLEPVRGAEVPAPREVHRLVWEACELIQTMEALGDTPGCTSCGARLEEIVTRLGELVDVAQPSGSLGQSWGAV